ncbi:MAG: molybdopterin-dependent oxidoreductase [Proteobacteria bacterium]|nr:molybdopterin-dependent oxidoreductase [Pseudomonadota bacterium]
MGTTTRRTLIQTAVGGLALASTGLVGQLARAGLPQGTLDSALLESLPGKKPLIKRSYRPPNYESPLTAFADVITPNDQFFVRWHLMNIPEVDPREWRLSIAGDAAATPIEFSLEQLRNDFESVEVVAVCQCAGNRRGLSDPHVLGVQWGSGAVGNARWRGVRLRDLLARAGLRKDAVEVAFAGGDLPALESTPQFVKSLPAWKAVDENTIVAYEMNGEALPHWNGFPARLVVPGWAATYWTKQVTSIQALSRPLSGFWMNPAYRIPKGKFPLVDRFVSQESETNMPVTEILVNSLITSVTDGQRCPVGRPVVVGGLAWDGGSGIREVDVSVDEGRSWESAELGTSLGRYSFRAWRYAFTPHAKGQRIVMARASSVQGSTQTMELIFNGAGYHNNVAQRVALQVI